jgi:hypothetical protein
MQTVTRQLLFGDARLQWVARHFGMPFWDAILGCHFGMPFWDAILGCHFGMPFWGIWFSFNPTPTAAPVCLQVQAPNVIQKWHRTSCK